MGAANTLINADRWGCVTRLSAQISSARPLLASSNSPEKTFSFGAREITVSRRLPKSPIRWNPSCEHKTWTSKKIPIYECWKLRTAYPPEEGNRRNNPGSGGWDKKILRLLRESVHSVDQVLFPVPLCSALSHFDACRRCNWMLLLCHVHEFSSWPNLCSPIFVGRPAAAECHLSTGRRVSLHQRCSFVSEASLVTLHLLGTISTCKRVGWFLEGSRHFPCSDTCIRSKAFRQ